MAHPQPPVRTEPSGWPHYKLWQRVHESILALPAYFKSETIIEGMLATDIFTLNSALGATIEEQVVQTLNAMRSVWDPEKQYQTYSFIRQPQTFPDVLLRKRTNGEDILLGIELKGWYLIAKEGMPSYRFTVSRDACSPQDMLVVVPWVLSNVLAGSPVVFPPFLDLARFAAEKRNFYWQHERKATGSSDITLATGISAYPAKSDKISDQPKEDKGGNFGRIARYGLMDAYVADMKALKIRGIPADAWLRFFKDYEKGVESPPSPSPPSD